ncbi:MAG: hypothetical protein QNJ70_28630 [Xenococcaceae cyanobacterium MO_207.B15]|nr:hypothetical protein [Xenococcaceae cyanobacterium MO_207.B15]
MVIEDRRTAKGGAIRDRFFDDSFFCLSDRTSWLWKKGDRFFDGFF